MANAGHNNNKIPSAVHPKCAWTGAHTPRSAWNFRERFLFLHQNKLLCFVWNIHRSLHWWHIVVVHSGDSHIFSFGRQRGSTMDMISSFKWCLQTNATSAYSNFSVQFVSAPSSMSSGMNSLAANLLEDFLQPMYRRWRGGELSERQRTFFAKVFGKWNGNWDY